MAFRMVRSFRMAAVSSAGRSADRGDGGDHAASRVATQAQYNRAARRGACGRGRPERERTMTRMTWLKATALVIAMAIPASAQTLVGAEFLASLRAGGY